MAGTGSPYVGGYWQGGVGLLGTASATSRSGSIDLASSYAWVDTYQRSSQANRPGRRAPRTTPGGPLRVPAVPCGRSTLALALPGAGPRPG